MNGRLIRWDEYLSRFDFEITHVEGIQNKVADCLSRLYENDTANDQYSPYDYVSADARLDPDLEDMTRLRAAELQSEDPILFARRIRHPIEDRIIEAQELHDNAEELRAQGHDMSAISLEESLASPQSLEASIEGDTTLKGHIQASYTQDPFFKKILDKVEAYPQFESKDGLLYVTVKDGHKCLCIPRVSRPGQKRLLTEQILDMTHSTVGHFGDLRTSEYTRRWYWW
ncbi:hypothetical protein B0H11DRAFT_1750598, partial [Mycena galericulata]